jgi:serine/threonine protein kinase
MTGGTLPVGDDGLSVVLAANGWADADEVTEARETLGDDANDAAIVQHLVEQGRMTGTQASDYEQIRAHQSHLPNFQLLRKIGSGGMGVVYFARHLATRRTCALKTINARLAEDQDTVNRFRREAETLSAISHVNVAEVVDVGEINGHVYLAMQYIEGPNLGALLKDHGRIPERYALKIMRQVADGLSYVYSAAGLIHRDIKPENVLMQRSTGNAAVTFPDDDVAKLIDFGLVKSMDDRHLNLTQTGMTIGTPLYMSPEQVRGDPLDCRSDFYGIAATLYHLVAGTPPYGGMSPGAIMSAHLTKPIPDPKEKAPGIHALTRTVIMAGMAKEFGERYRHYSDLIAALDKAIAAVAERDGAAADGAAADGAAADGAAADGAAPASAPAAEAAGDAGAHAAPAPGGQQGHGDHALTPPAGAESGRFRPQVKVDLPNIEHLATGSAVGPSPVKAAPAPTVAPPAPKSGPAIPSRPGSTTKLVPAAPPPGSQPTIRTSRPAPAPAAPDAAGLPTLTPTPARSAERNAGSLSATHAAAPPVQLHPANPPRADLPQVGVPTASAETPAATAPAPERRSRPVAPPGSGIGGNQARGELVVTGTEDPGASGSRVGAASGTRVGATTASGRAVGSPTGTNSGARVGSTTASDRAIGSGSGNATGTAKAMAPATPAAPAPAAPQKPSDMIAVHALEIELSQAKQTPQTSYLPWIMLAVGVAALIALLVFGLAG